MDRSVVNVAAVLKDENKLFPIDAEIRRKVDLVLHRRPLSHPARIRWDNKRMPPFIKARRHWDDERAALIWDMQRSVNDALRAVGCEPKTTAVPIYEEHAVIVSSILAQAMVDPNDAPRGPELLQALNSFRDVYLDFLVEHPDGQVGAAVS